MDEATPCTCVSAGYCDRHRIRKSAHWVRLCQTRENYFRAWEEGRGPGQPRSQEQMEAYQARLQSIALAQEQQLQFLRQLWSELHQFAISQRDKWDMSYAQSWFNSWSSKIPRKGCSCWKHWNEILDELPPQFSTPREFYYWSVAAHNLVNVSLGKPTYHASEFL